MEVVGVGIRVCGDPLRRRRDRRGVRREWDDLGNGGKEGHRRDPHRRPLRGRTRRGSENAPPIELAGGAGTTSFGGTTQRERER